MFLCRAQCPNAKGRPMCQSPISLACPMPSTGSKGESIEEIGALWGAWAAWADGSGAEGLVFLAGRWGPAGSDESTQFVSHPEWFTISYPHLPQCCWAVLESSWAFLPSSSHSPAHPGLVLQGSNYTEGGRPTICSGSSTRAGIHWIDLLLRMKRWEKQAQVRA